MNHGDQSSAADGATADLVQKMRADWNSRASEDVRFYIACSRRDETEDEFRAHAKDVVRRVRRDLHWLPPSRSAATRRFLEIGCGIGRLMEHLASDCGEIHGVDISDEMVTRGQARLADIAHAHFHVTTESDLRAFASSSFDLVYSYAVLQHLPAELFFWRYIGEALRVLKPGGLLIFQFNGIVEDRPFYDTWAGVMVPAAKVVAACQTAGSWIRSLEGEETQYVWITAQKFDSDALLPSGFLHIDEVTGADDVRGTIIAGGADGFMSLYIKNLPAHFCDVTDLSIELGTCTVIPNYVGAPDRKGRRQINAFLPPAVPAGAAQIVLLWRGRAVSKPYPVRVIPRTPTTPRILRLSDGVELGRLNIVTCGWLKVWLSDVEDPTQLSITVGSLAASEVIFSCEDKWACRYQVNVRIPDAVPTGETVLAIQAGHVDLPPARFLLVRD